jgi:hypothetical protein
MAKMPLTEDNHVYAVKGLRLADKRARSGSPFRLFGTASVGSQSLTGIARLHQLRNDPKLVARLAIAKRNESGGIMLD